MAQDIHYKNKLKSDRKIASEKDVNNENVILRGAMLAPAHWEISATF